MSARGGYIQPDDDDETHPDDNDEEVFDNSSVPLDESDDKTEESKDETPPDVSQDPVDVSIRIRVLELYLPPHNKKIKDIATLLNRSRSFIYYKLQELVALKQLEKNEKTGHIVRELPESQIDGYADIMKTDFNKYKSIERWVSKMKRDKIKNWAYQVTNLYKICKTLERNPDHFLAPLEIVEQMMEDFEEKFRKGESFYIDKKNFKINQNRADVSISPFIKAVRSFRQRLGHPVPKNVGGILSVSEETGNYARLKMTDSQIKKGIAYMMNVSVVMGTLFIMHHELGVRTDTLFNMLLTFRQKIIEVIDPKTNETIPCECYIVDVHEKKTEEDYAKIVFSPPARTVLKRMKQGQTLIDKGDWKSKKFYNQHLKNFYKSVGLITGEESPKKGTQEYYLREYPSHYIRHSWSHWLMRCTGFNATVVSKFAWEDTKTLTKVYSKQSIDEILNIGDCEFCRPSKYKKPEDDKYFCCLQHAIAFFNIELPPDLADDKSGDDEPPTPSITNDDFPKPDESAEFEKTNVNLGTSEIIETPENKPMLVSS